MNLLPPLLSRSILPTLRLLAAGLALGAASAGALAQQPDEASSLVYTCTDAHGNRLTSDRPILACIDREQRVLNRSGTTVRVIPPTLTAAEREAREAREREAAAQRQRERDAIRRDQALLTRYPDKATHDAAREEALAQTVLVLDTIQARLDELSSEREELKKEMEFYSKDPSSAPPKLRRAVEENIKAVETQWRAIAAKQEERKRINASFDAEAQRLQLLWQARDAAARR